MFARMSKEFFAALLLLHLPSILSSGVGCSSDDCEADDQHELSLLLLQTRHKIAQSVAVDKEVLRASSCDASAAPTNGAVGSCTDALASGSTCQPTCDSGYTVSGSSSCFDGVLTAATCGAPVEIWNGAKCFNGSGTNEYLSDYTGDSALDCAALIKNHSECSQLYFNLAGSKGACGCIYDVDIDCTDADNIYYPSNDYDRDVYAVRSYTCDASTAPTNGGVGNCTSNLSSGSVCLPTCDDGYTVSGTSLCTGGALTPAYCYASPCDASAAPANGSVGDCTDDLASGSTCTPTCDSGYTLTCSSSCSYGTLTAGTCEAPTLYMSGYRCDPNTYVKPWKLEGFSSITCAGDTCTVVECAAFIKENPSNCSQSWFNYATKNGGCGCISDLDEDCATASVPNNTWWRELYYIPTTASAC
jgi:hypothetical protein